MFNFLCNRTLHYARKCSALKKNDVSISYILVNHKLDFLEFHQPFSSSSIISASNQGSIVVSYLINSCGLSQERALSASKYINFETPENADSVLAFLKEYGFSFAQISSLVRKRSIILSFNPEKTFVPKLEFLESIGVSRLVIPKMICTAPNILTSSLENQISPAFNLLKNLFHSHEDAMFAVNRYPEVLVKNFNTTVAPNIEILREAGVSESSILYCLKCLPKVIVINPQKFKEYVERAKIIGFNPQKTVFLRGLKVIALTATSTWERKMEVYKRCGWSEEEVLAAFRRQPQCIMASDAKIIGVTDILVHKMGYHISRLAKSPVLILLSLTKTIVPRCSVYQVLLLKGLLKNNLSLTNCLICTEQFFLERFVQRYEEAAPELLKLYQEKMQLSK